MACILTYHKIGRQLELGITWVSPRRLRQHLDLLAGTGLPLTRATVAAGGSVADAVAITFDDGYESVYTEALPELETRRLPATVFPVVGSIGSSNTWDVRLSARRFRHLSWPQLEELARRGFELGSHTLSHRDLTSLGDADLRDELVRSKQMLEQRTGAEVTAIAYPFGKFDERVVAAALEAGYRWGFTNSPERSACGPRASMCVGRMSVYCMDGPASIQRKLGTRPGRGFEVAKNRFAARLSHGTAVLKRLGLA